MSWQTEFPDFPAADLPAIPPGFEDTSWHNDTCPSFTSDEAGLTIWVDYLAPASREYEGAYPRFGVTAQDHGVETSGPSLMTDSWEEVLAFIDARSREKESAS